MIPTQHKAYCGDSPPSGAASLGQVQLDVLQTVLQENPCPKLLSVFTRKWEEVGNTNQPECFGLKNGHEDKRGLLWDTCIKDFKHQCWYLLVVALPAQPALCWATQKGIALVIQQIKKEFVSCPF